MAVIECLVELGGVASRSQLVDLTSRALVDQALSRGEVTRVARGRLALPDIDEGLRAAHALSAVLSHTSAALHWGWAVAEVPERPHVTVPEKRRVSQERRSKVVLHRSDLHPDDVTRGVTTPEHTLLQCLRALPFGQGLAVADSALRCELPPSVLRRISASVRGPGAPRVRRVCAEATQEAANPFESVLRAICLDIPGLRVRPQRFIAPHVRPDLVDEDLRVVIEADSFAWHGDRAALKRDARRYNQMVVDGWLVLRFTWEDVMHDQHLARAHLQGVVKQRGEVSCAGCSAA